MLRAINIATENVDYWTQRELKLRQESDSFVGDSKDQIQRSIAVHGQNPPAVSCVHQVQPVNHPTN